MAMLGGAAGLAIAKWSLYIVRTMNPGNVPRFETIGINGAVLAFTFGISLATGILFGFARRGAPSRWISSPRSNPQAAVARATPGYAY
jgi:hypothetical protein